MKKRIFAMILSLTMVMAMLPATAFAAEEDDGINTAEELQAAITAAEAGTTIELTGNVVMPAGEGLALTKDITIDLGEYNIIGSRNYLILASAGADVILNATTGGVQTDLRHVATVMTDATMTINGGNYVGEISTWKSGEITLNNVKVTSVKYSDTDSSYAVYAQEGGEITINGGSYTNPIRADYYDAAVVACGAGEVVINGNAYVEGEYALACNAQCPCTTGGKITVNGGTFTGTAGLVQIKNNADQAIANPENYVKFYSGTFSNAAAAEYCADNYGLFKLGVNHYQVLGIAENLLDKALFCESNGGIYGIDAVNAEVDVDYSMSTFTINPLNAVVYDADWQAIDHLVTIPDGEATIFHVGDCYDVTFNRAAAPDFNVGGTSGGSDSNATTETDSTGTKSETTVDANGVQTTEVKVSGIAVSQAAKADEAIELPMAAVTATTNSATAAEVKIDLPKGTTAKVEIPVANVTAGTVAVIVHADGTEEVVPYSVPTEDGIELTVEGDVTVKIVDKSTNFSDVPATHTFNDAVDFASARGIIEGYGDSFGVKADATSAACVTVIARMMGQDFYGSGSTTKAKAWADELGLSEGLDLSGKVTRQQYMLLLWRAAGSPAATNKTVDSTDAATIDAAAVEAFAWAMEIGLVGGYDDGSVRPNGNISRGAMAAIAQRYMIQQ